MVDGECYKGHSGLEGDIILPSLLLCSQKHVKTYIILLQSPNCFKSIITILPCGLMALSGSQFHMICFAERYQACLGYSPPPHPFQATSMKASASRTMISSIWTPHCLPHHKSKVHEHLEQPWNSAQSAHYFKQVECPSISHMLGSSHTVITQQPLFSSKFCMQFVDTV